MPFADTSYDLETQKALSPSIRARLGASPGPERFLPGRRREVRIMKAAATGERDPDRLRDAVRRRDPTIQISQPATEPGSSRALFRQSRSLN